MQTWKIALTVIGVLLIIVAAYYTTYYIASRGSRRIARGRSIKLYDSFALSKDKFICTVEAGGRVYILAMSSGAITVLDSFEAEQYARSQEKRAGEDSPPINIEGLQYGLSSLINNPLLKKITELFKKREAGRGREPEEGTPVQFAREEDGLDAVYRKIQTRRSMREKDGQHWKGEE